jgi:lipopolysaccharide biosynthesis glycosyltransferase
LKTQRQNQFYGSWISSSFTKWNLLQFTCYQKVMFVDADKIILKNIDHLFELRAPAGTFSVPWADGSSKFKAGGGMMDPYETKHGSLIPTKSVDAGLYAYNSFVLIGTMVLMEPNMDHFKQFQSMLSKLQPFGFRNCNSGLDEQSIVHFYHSLIKKQWTMIDPVYNYVPWHPQWIACKSQPGWKPNVFHYFNTKPWTQSRQAWPDLEAWWQTVGFLVDRLPNLKSRYKKQDLEWCIPEQEQKCCYCHEKTHLLFDPKTKTCVCPSLSALKK